MEQLKKLIVEMENTSEVLKDASEYMKRLEKEVEFKDLCYKKAQTVILALYLKGKNDPEFMEQMPEVEEYMLESVTNDTV